MIDYSDGYFGFHTLFRIYGSAAYKGTLMATISSGVYCLLYYYGGGYDGENGLKHHELLDHPYPVAVIVSAFIVILSAKVNFSYNRFWEACTALHNMHAKWLDVGSTVAAFHMQSKSYENIQPPSFGDYHNIVTDDLVLQRDRTQETETTEPTKLPQSDEGGSKQTKNGASSFGSFLNRKNRKKGRSKGSNKTASAAISIHASTPPNLLPFPTNYLKNNPIGGAGSFDATTRTARCSSTSNCDGKNNAIPTLFLQEAAHLVSLLSAVALSTLRCDFEDAKAPLTEFIPGRHWPNYNSDNDRDMQEYGYHRNGFVKAIKYMFDISRTKSERLEYNAARPFPVIGGTSDREAFLLQSARGSSAKVALVFMWLQEFIIREHLHGSLGSVAPPIVSRIPQFLSDGHLWYNAARKMSYIPFPFPHTQLTMLFEIVSIVLIPGLMLSKTAAWFGLVLNFLTVMLFSGLNELSKELEYPFRGMPNDLPLNLFHAQFNEAVVTMFSGFHPDSWWEIKGDA